MFEDADLLHGEAKSLAVFLGVSVRTIQMYKSGRVPLPVPSRKLLQLRLTGDLSALLGLPWEGFSFGRDGLLYVPGWRNGFAPDQIRALFFTVQEVAALKHQVRDLRGEVWALRKMQSLSRDNQAVRVLGGR